MTIGEFRSAEVKHKGSETIWIGKHKTAVQYGHASLFINPNVYKALEAYQDKIRSMTKPSTKAFFCSLLREKDAVECSKEEYAPILALLRNEGASWVILAPKGWCHIGEQEQSRLTNGVQDAPLNFVVD